MEAVSRVDGSNTAEDALEIFLLGSLFGASLPTAGLETYLSFAWKQACKYGINLSLGSRCPGAVPVMSRRCLISYKIRGIYGTSTGHPAFKVLSCTEKTLQLYGLVRI
jgi:hypothetical protein